MICVYLHLDTSIGTSGCRGTEKYINDVPSYVYAILLEYLSITILLTRTGTLNARLIVMHTSNRDNSNDAHL